MIKCKDSENWCILTGISMLEISKKDNFKDSAYINIKEIKINIKATGIKALNLAMEDVLSANINQFMKDIGKRICDREWGESFTKMVTFSREVFIQTIWTARVYWSMLMEKYSSKFGKRENFKTELKKSIIDWIKNLKWFYWCFYSTYL